MSAVAIDSRLSARDALLALHAARGGRDVVVTTMASARDWMTFPPHPLDLVFVPSAMGHAPSVGLGLALARPDRRVVVCNGDGSMLMNLGSLASITEAGPRNLALVVLVNGVYEVTGSQPVPSTRVDFAAVARGAGFRSVFDVRTVDAWTACVPALLEGDGPLFAALHVAPVAGVPGPRSPGPAGERARRFMDALRQS